MKTLLIILILIPSNFAMASLPLGESPKEVSLSDENGGKVDGTAWSSSSLKGKVHILFYVDPDEKNANEEFEKMLNKKEFPNDKFASVAVINMAATWKPNWMISGILRKKQKKYPDTTYVRDYKKILVKEWKLKDDSYDILIFDKEGKVIFGKDGKLSPKEMDNALATIESNI